MIKHISPILLFLLILTACSKSDTLSDASEAEMQMAKRMGISVGEMRNQTPEEHMQMMEEMMRGEKNEKNVGFLPGMNVDVASLPDVKRTETLEVKDGDSIELNPTLVKKTINNKAFAMYGYNGQIPGPIIKARRGSSITVKVNNNIDMPTTIHWHGLRHENKEDGVPDLTQPAIEPGDAYTYTVKFPDEGMYWYHPHVREDIQQDMGLYGNLLVESDQATYAKVDMAQVIILDDLLLDENGDLVPFGKENATHPLMGRFGSLFLINGTPVTKEKTGLTSLFQVPAGTSVRFYVTNVSNTQTFRLHIDGAQMKLVGSDLGRYEHEEWVEEIIIAPAERAIVEATLTTPKTTYYLVHRGSSTPYALAQLKTTDASPLPQKPDVLLTHEDVIKDIDQFRKEFDRPVDKTLHLSIETNMMHMDHQMMQAEGSVDGIEWEDSMAMMNEMSDKENTQWKIIDEETGAENMDINWTFKKESIAKIRIVNDENSDHPMQHPIHFHGQRFLILSMDGKKNENLVWKDTVLIPKGSTADLLFDMSNPGDWMFHCHIAEHLTNGMMGMFHVIE